MAQPQLASIEQQSIVPPSFDIKLEKDRIRTEGPLLLTQRDERLYQWLDEQRESGSPGYICYAKGSGLSEVCQRYRMLHVKSRGNIQKLPVPVVYMRATTHCSASVFYTELLQALNHPITTGRLKDKRPRARGRLKSFRTNLLIVDDAEFLAYEAFCELIQIYDTLKIPTILCGTYYLETTIKKNYWDRVTNSFLDFYEYPLMTINEMIGIISTWEKEFLKWPETSDLLNENLVNKIYQNTKGSQFSLNSFLSKVATITLNQGSFKITAETIELILANRGTPRLKPGKGDGE